MNYHATERIAASFAQDAAPAATHSSPINPYRMSVPGELLGDS